MRHSTAKHTSKITSGEDNTHLLSLAHFILGLAVGLDQLLTDSLECHKLDNGVRHLTSPEGTETSVQVTKTFLGNHLGKTVGKTTGERRVGLHTNLDGLERAESHVGEHLSTSRTEQVHQIAVGDGVLLAECLGKVVLVDLIETKLEQTLHRVANKGRGPTLGQTTEATAEAQILHGTRVDVAETSKGVGELVRVGLGVALDQIQRSDSSVRKTTAENTTNTAHGKVLGGVQLDAALRSGVETSVARFGGASHGLLELRENAEHNRKRRGFSRKKRRRPEV
mmetsp:Transcript_9842/g.24572  ORF Transcript_9842/g.24572 Transcript_9842/m.24572 type:complete len:281 (+) Transcript_9842:301-1143(+)